MQAKFVEMTSQNQRLQDQNRELMNENRQLKEEISGLKGKGQLPVEVMRRQDSYISHPPSQVDQNVQLQVATVLV